MTIYAFDGFSVLRDNTGEISAMKAASYLVTAKNKNASISQSETGEIVTKGLMSAGMLGSALAYEKPPTDVNILEMMSGTMMGTNVLYDIPEFPGWLVDVMASKLKTSPITASVTSIPVDNLEMMSGMLTGTDILFDIPDFPGASNMWSGSITGLNVQFTIDGITGEGPNGSWVGSLRASDVVFSIPNFPDGENSQNPFLVSGNIEFNIPGLPGADGMMSGTVTGTNVLFDFPTSPSDGVWNGSLKLTDLQFQVPTANGMMSGTVTGTNVLFDIPDVPGSNSVQADMLTGSGNWKYIPVRRAVEGLDVDSYSLLQRIETDPGLLDDMLNTAGAKMFDVSWNAAGSEQTAVVLKLTDPDTGAEHFFGMSGAKLPDFDGSSNLAETWLNTAVFTTPTPAETEKAWILFFDEADAVFKSQADYLTGTEENDRIITGKGKDFVFAMAGDDLIKGGVGNDGINGGDGLDRIKGGGGRDVLVGGEGNDLMWGQKGADIMDGGADRDTLYGGAGNDVLSGGIGKDLLVGGRGRDILIGGEYTDVMVGGAGADIFVFDALATKAIDTIQDFKAGVDKIYFVEADGTVDVVIDQLGRLTRVFYNDSLVLLSLTDADTITDDDFVTVFSDSLI